VSRLPRPRKIWLFAVAACIPCCVPLLIPALAAVAGGLSAWSFGSAWYAVAGAAVVTFAAAFVLLRRRTHHLRPAPAPMPLPLVDEWERR
jgi:uncharacterized membrane protein